MDTNELKNATQEIQNAINKIGEKYGFTAKLGGITYNDAGFHTTLKTTYLETKQGISGAELEYRTYAKKFGINPNTFGQVFSFENMKYIIIGIAPKARTYPIVAKGEDGKTYKFPAIVLKTIFKGV